MRDACSFEGSKVEFTVCCCLLQELRRGGMGTSPPAHATVQLQADTHALTAWSADRLQLNSSDVPRAPLVVVTPLPCYFVRCLHSPLL